MSTTGRKDRVALIRSLEAARDSTILVYVCGDQPGLPTQIGDDAVRPMYDHIRGQRRSNLDLFIYSRGGHVEVPWRIVSMLREQCSGRLAALIPYKAHSAATMIALGCDEIAMGPKAELGPVDPALSIRRQQGGAVTEEEIRVEDVMSYVGFLRDKAGLSDQAVLGNNAQALTEKLEPWAIGQIYRTFSHIRLVARKLLTSHRKRMEDAKIAAIIESLAEKTYLHGHAISRTEAEELGLPVVRLEDAVAATTWRLLEAYEERLQILEPFDPQGLLGDDTDERTFEADGAIIESADRVHIFRQRGRARRIRQTPQALNINLNLTLSLPAQSGAQVAADPRLQEFLQRLQAELAQQVDAKVREQVRQQSAEAGFQVVPRPGRWLDVTQLEN